jgi:hypothetical protein
MMTDLLEKMGANAVCMQGTSPRWIKYGNIHMSEKREISPEGDGRSNRLRRRPSRPESYGQK